MASSSSMIMNALFQRAQNTPRTFPSDQAGADVTANEISRSVLHFQREVRGIMSTQPLEEQFDWAFEETYRKYWGDQGAQEFFDSISPTVQGPPALPPTSNQPSSQVASSVTASEIVASSRVKGVNNEAIATMVAPSASIRRASSTSQYRSYQEPLIDQSDRAVVIYDPSTSGTMSAPRSSSANNARIPEGPRGQSNGLRESVRPRPGPSRDAGIVFFKAKNAYPAFCGPKGRYSLPIKQKFPLVKIDYEGLKDDSRGNLMVWWEPRYREHQSEDARAQLSAVDRILRGYHRWDCPEFDTCTLEAFWFANERKFRDASLSDAHASRGQQLSSRQQRSLRLESSQNLPSASHYRLGREAVSRARSRSPRSHRGSYRDRG